MQTAIRHRLVARRATSEEKLSSAIGEWLALVTQVVSSVSSWLDFVTSYPPVVMVRVHRCLRHATRHCPLVVDLQARTVGCRWQNTVRAVRL